MLPSLTHLDVYILKIHNFSDETVVISNRKPVDVKPQKTSEITNL